MLDNDDLMSIVVLEAGAAWPAWLTEYQRLAPNAIVVVQAMAEAADVFSARVVHRIEEAKSRADVHVRVGVIVSAEPTDEGKSAMREAIARAILRAMGSQSEAELVLAGDGGEADPSRHELFALAGVLCQELGGTSVSVRVRFSGKSGVMRSVATASPEDAVASKGPA